MRIRYLAMVLATVMLGVFLSTGCSTSNEEAIKGPTPVVPQDPGAPVITTYGEAVKQSEAQAKAKAAEAKAARKKP
jgi:hypothetical protein